MRFRLAFALHNHQPVGNFETVFENAHSHCYSPFLKLARKFPHFRFSLHQSGILWDWQKQHHPGYFELVNEMVKSGQVELLSGAFYEPIMTAIPDRDKIGQIKMLNTYLKKHFKVDARGMWLAERVWEPHLPKIISNCGLNYLPIDDTHFRYAGFADEELSGAFITEEAGRAITLFPILNRLRYLIPFGQIHEIIQFLREAQSKHHSGLATYADDGEKFGIWPGTYKHCYQDKWLERFFGALEENGDWLDVVPLSEAADKCHLAGRAYLPSASYHEMLHWALPTRSFMAFEDFETRLKENDLTEKYGRFVRGGHWRGFLTKYEEANLMHKKMMMVSDLLAEIEENSEVDPKILEKARDLLYAGQCNCPYWHGVFGGLYLPHLRRAVYDKLLAAEKILREASGRKVYALFRDYDFDGHEDIMLGGENLSVVISPRHGGRITELSCLETGVNLTDCLTRRLEGYHRKLLDLSQEAKEESARSIHDMVVTKEEGLDKLIVEDWYLRRLLIDHFIPENTDINGFLAGRYKELGDFVIEPFEKKFTETDSHYEIILERQGNVWHGDFRCPVRLAKSIRFPRQGNSLIINYRLLQKDLELMPVRFAVEFNFNLLAPNAEDRYTLVENQKPKKNPHLAAVAQHRQVSSIAYIDDYYQTGVRIDASRPGLIWRMPIFTVSLSEGGFEKVFQGNCTLLIFETSLPADQEYSFELILSAGPPAKITYSKDKDKASVQGK